MRHDSEIAAMQAGASIFNTSLCFLTILVPCYRPLLSMESDFARGPLGGWLAWTKLARVSGERSLVRKRGFEPRWDCSH